MIRKAFDYFQEEAAVSIGGSIDKDSVPVFERPSIVFIKMPGFLYPHIILVKDVKAEDKVVGELSAILEIQSGDFDALVSGIFLGYQESVDYYMFSEAGFVPLSFAKEMVFVPEWHVNMVDSTGNCQVGFVCKTADNNLCNSCVPLGSKYVIDCAQGTIAPLTLPHPDFYKALNRQIAELLSEAINMSGVAAVRSRNYLKKSLHEGNFLIPLSRELLQVWLCNNALSFWIMIYKTLLHI